jgi:hypothetical protein
MDVTARGRRLVPAQQGEQAGAAEAMKQRTLHTLYGYWNELRAGRLAPQRLEIEPSRIAGILSETFMLERVEAGNYQFRLAGTRLCELFSSELRGSNFLDGWSDADRSVLERQLTTICQQGAVVVLGIEGGEGRHRIELEAILLPLLHAGNRIARIIGAMSATSAPHWLETEPLRSRRLTRHEVLWPDGRPHSLVERMGRHAPFVAKASEPRAVKPEQRQFRVVQGGLADDKIEER